MAETRTVLHKHFTDPTQTGKTRHSFPAADGRKYVTFKAEVAAEAEKFLGQPAVIEFTYRQNGQYENYYLESIKAVNGSAVNQVARALRRRAGRTIRAPRPTRARPASRGRPA